MSKDDAGLVSSAVHDDGRPTAALLEAYEAGPTSLRSAVAGMDAGQLRARPIPGKFSTLEVVGHLTDSDQFLADRIKRTVATERPLLIGVDGERYLGALHYQDRELAMQLDLFEAGRRQLAADLRCLAPEAWERTGVHSEVGLVTVRQQLFHAVRHLERHLAAIAEKRRALGLS